MRITIVLTLLALWAAPSPKLSHAVEYEFSAIVNSVDSPLISEFHAGEILTGTLSLSPPIRSTGVAYYSVTKFSADIGGNYPITATGGSFDVFDDFGGAIDRIELQISTPLGLSAPTVAGHVAEYFTFNLFYDMDVPSSTGLLPQFALDGLDGSNLRFDGNDSIEIHYTLTNFSVVPEPSSLLPAVLGGTMLFFEVRRRASSALRI